MLGGQRDPGRARDRIRNILLVALQAARYGPPRTLPLQSQLWPVGATLRSISCSSIAWLGWNSHIGGACTGQELTPTFIDGMKCFFEIEEWLYARE